MWHGNNVRNRMSTCQDLLSRHKRSRKQKTENHPPRGFRWIVCHPRTLPPPGSTGYTAEIRDGVMIYALSVVFHHGATERSWSSCEQPGRAPYATEYTAMIELIIRSCAPSLPNARRCVVFRTSGTYWATKPEKIRHVRLYMYTVDQQPVAHP